MELDAEQAINELETQTNYAKSIRSEGVLLSAKCATFVLEHARYYEQRIKELTEELQKLKKVKYIFSTVDYCADDLAKALEENKKLTEENERLRAENEASVDDLKQCMYYAKPKRPNTCNFCIHDCEVSKDGTQCKGKDDWIYCTPVWRGVVKVKAEGE